MKDSWFVLRIVTLLIFAGLLALVGVFALNASNVSEHEFALGNLEIRISDTAMLAINSLIMVLTAISGLLGIFLGPRRDKKGTHEIISNKSFGILSVALVILIAIINPHNFMELTLNLKWRSYMLTVGLLFLQAALMIIYMELLWSLANFQEETYAGQANIARNLKFVNQMHYLKFLPILLFFNMLFLAVATVFTTFFVFSSRPVFLNSLVSGSVYPFFAVGMICLGILLFILLIAYTWYRFVKTEPEAFMEPEEPGVFENA